MWFIYYLSGSLKHCVLFHLAFGTHNFCFGGDFAINCGNRFELANTAFICQQFHFQHQLITWNDLAFEACIINAHKEIQLAFKAIFPDTVIIRGELQVDGKEFCGERLGKDVCG